MVTLEEAVVVICGAGALVIEANRQFGQSPKSHGHQRYSILRGVHPSSLCTPAEHRRGWMFYICCYLLIYAIVLISDSLRGVLYDTASGQKVAGATGWKVNGGPDQELLGATDLATPIYVSAAIIALLSTGVASKAERIVRAVAYRLAGIPRGVYRLITRVSRIDYSTFIGDAPSPLVQTYDNRISDLQATPLLQPIIDETREALEIIALLTPAVIGDYGTRFWPRENVHRLDELIKTQAENVAEMMDQLEKLEPSPEAVELFHLRAIDTRNNHQALFSILYIRNQTAYLPSDHNATARIITTLRESSGTPPLTHQVTISLMTSAFFFLLSYFFIDILYQHGRASPQSGPPSSFVETLTAEAGNAAAEAIIGAISFLVLFGVAASAAAMIRETQKENNNWKDWQFGALPMLRFLRASFWPVLLSGCALIVWEFCSEMVLISYHNSALPTEQQAAAVLRTMFPFYLFPFLLSIVISLFVFVAADKHRDLSAWKTLAIATGMAAMYLLLCAFAVSSTYGFVEGVSSTESWYAVKESVLHALPAFLFFVSLALLLEVSEGVDED